MGHKQRAGIARFLAVAAAVCGVTLAAAQDVDELQQKRDALKGEIARLTDEIARVDSAAALEKNRFAVLKQRHEADAERRQQEIADLENKIREGYAAVAAEKNKQAGLKRKGEEIRQRDRFLSAMQSEYCEKLEQLILRSVPWEREARLDRIRSLRRDIEANTASAEEVFSRLNAVMSEESRFGDEIALVRAPMVRSDGETVNAQVLRLGNQAMVYMDDQEKRFGILERVADSEEAAGWSWREELSFGEREAVRKALEVKGNKRPPELTVLPFGIAVSPDNKVVSPKQGGEQ